MAPGLAPVITRFEVDMTLGTTMRPMVEKARSYKAGTPATPYNLGYAVYGLDVGDFHTRPGLEVVAAAYRRIAVFDAVTLELVLVKELPDWEHTQPRRLQIVEMYSGNSSAEVVFTTLHGRIVVMGMNGGSLDILGEHSESGIVDLVVGPEVETDVPGSFTKVIYVMSVRGHIVGLSFDSTGTPKHIAKVRCASKLQYSTMWDLEVKDGKIVALFSGGDPSIKSLRVFNPTTLALEAEYGSISDTLYPTFRIIRPECSHCA